MKEESEQSAFYTWKDRMPKYAELVIMIKRDFSEVTGRCGDNGVYLDVWGGRTTAYEDFLGWKRI